MPARKPSASPLPFPGLLLLAAVLLAIGAAGAWFRIADTTRNPLWLDEGYSAYAAAKGFAFLWHVTPLYETHPPFYYSLLRVWTLLFGDSLVALRALGIACGLLTLGVALLVARELARWFSPALRFLPLAPLLLLLAAFSPALIGMAREVRPYPVMILVYAGALLALLRLGRIAAREGRIDRAAFGLYVCALALLLWLHNLGPLYGLALGLALLALVARKSLSGRDWALLVGGHVLAGLIYLPAFLILLDQAPTWIHSTWLRFSFTGLPERLTILWAAPGAMAGIAALVLALLGAMTLLRLREGWRVAAALLLLALLPVALSILISVVKAPVFIPRTMTPTAVPALVLLAVGASLRRGWVRWPALLAFLLLVFSMVRTDRADLAGPPMEDWYGATAWLAQHMGPGDEIWSYPNEGALPLDYALRDKRLALVNRPIPTPVPTLHGGPGSWYPTGSRGVVSLSPERLRAIASTPQARAIPTIWLNRLGANAYDEGDVFLHALEADRVVVARWTSRSIDIVGLRRRDLAKR